MFSRYHIAVFPANAPLPDTGIAPEESRRLALSLDKCQVLIETPDAPQPAGLCIDRDSSSGTLTITEGTIIPTGTPGPLQSGTYNQITITNDGNVTIHNDTFGLLACYYARRDDSLHIANAHRLLQRGAGLSHDALGIAERFLFGDYTPNQRTILDGGTRVAAGSESTFDLHNGRSPTIRRLTDTWTTILDERLDVAVDRVCELWQTAVARHVDPVETPIGLMLSGGLDSRMVAGGIASRGKSFIGLTFGDLASDEVRIAGEVAAATGATWLTSGLDESFSIDRFNFERVNQMNESLYNLMWDANLPMLAAEGATHYTTGATFETILGGQRDIEPRQRMMKNLRNALLGPWQTLPATTAERDIVIDQLMERARKRARNYAFLLTEPYRSLMTDSLPAVEAELTERIHEITAAGSIAPGQIIERFDSENYQTQHSRDQERQLLSYGDLMLPTCDRDLANYLTNLPAAMKYDHALYYHVIRRLYPDLAAIDVPNLGTGVNKSQLQIELVRAWRIQRKARLTSWVNFGDWMAMGDNLDKYEQRFLDQTNFFDADAVQRWFKDIRAGRKFLYDGSESAGFLNLAMLLDAHRLTV